MRRVKGTSPIAAIDMSVPVVSPGLLSGVWSTSLASGAMIGESMQRRALTA
jgi:hypothetical protein